MSTKDFQEEYETVQNTPINDEARYNHFTHICLQCYWADPSRFTRIRRLDLKSEEYVSVHGIKSPLYEYYECSIHGLVVGLSRNRNARRIANFEPSLKTFIVEYTERLERAKKFLLLIEADREKALRENRTYLAIYKMSQETEDKIKCLDPVDVLNLIANPPQGYND